MESRLKTSINIVQCDRAVSDQASVRRLIGVWDPSLSVEPAPFPPGHHDFASQRYVTEIIAESESALYPLQRGNSLNE